MKPSSTSWNRNSFTLWSSSKLIRLILEGGGKKNETKWLIQYGLLSMKVDSIHPCIIYRCRLPIVICCLLFHNWILLVYGLLLQQTLDDISLSVLKSRLNQGYTHVLFGNFINIISLPFDWVYQMNDEAKFSPNSNHCGNLIRIFGTNTKDLLLLNHQTWYTYTIAYSIAVTRPDQPSYLLRYTIIWSMLLRPSKPCQ